MISDILVIATAKYFLSVFPGCLPGTSTFAYVKPGAKLMLRVLHTHSNFLSQGDCKVRLVGRNLSAN